MPIKNIFKFALEFIPYSLQKIAKLGMKKLDSALSRKDEPASFIPKVLAAANYALLGLGYYATKAVRVAARTVLSPVTSFRVGLEIHYALGIASIIASVLGIAAVTILTLPVTFGLAAVVTAKLGLTALSAFYSKLCHLTFMSMGTRWLASIASTVVILTGPMTIVKGLYKSAVTDEPYYPSHENVTAPQPVTKVKVEDIREKLPLLHTKKYKPKPANNTSEMMKVLDAKPATTVTATPVADEQPKPDGVAEYNESSLPLGLFSMLKAAVWDSKDEQTNNTTIPVATMTSAKK